MKTRLVFLVSFMVVGFSAIWLPLLIKNDIANLPTIPMVYSFGASPLEHELSHMTLEQKVSSLLILHTPGYDYKKIKQYINTYQPGGLILMGDNIPDDLDDLKRGIGLIQDDQKKPPYFMAIDQEGGDVRRIKTDNFLSPSQLGSLSASQTKDNFKARSQLLAGLGINLNFGIVADVNDDEDSFIFSRVFGGDADLVADRVAMAVDGSKGITLTTVKHYPGHGETGLDSHNVLPITNVSYSDWQKKDAKPFESGVKAGVDFVMFGHLIYNQVDFMPASLSKKWHDILLSNTGFDGISITDDMVMLQQSGDSKYSNPVKNAILALKAGNTMLLYVTDHYGGQTDIDPSLIVKGVVSAIKDGEISIESINSSARRVLQLRYDLHKNLSSG